MTGTIVSPGKLVEILLQDLCKPVGPFTGDLLRLIGCRVLMAAEPVPDAPLDFSVDGSPAA